MRRRITSRAGQVALMVVLFVVATLAVSVVVGVLGSSNLVWGEDNQYARIDIPGTTVVHLPSGTVDANVAIDIPGKGNATVPVPLPAGLSLSVTSSVSGSARPVVTQDLGDARNANDDRVNSQRRVWHVHVPQSGDYRVAVRGDFAGIGINPELWLGHGPPIPGGLVPVIAAAIVLLAGLIWFLLIPRLRGKPGRPKRASDPAGRIDELSDLHSRGLISDDEFFAEKAKINL